MQKDMERIVPVPQKAQRTDGELRLDRRSSVALTVPQDLTDASLTAANLLRETLGEICGEKGLSGGENAVKVTLQWGEAPPEVQRPEEGYELVISPMGITLTGFGANGMLYAVVTLRQLMKQTSDGASFPACRVLDWPARALRCLKIESRYGSNLMTKEDWFAMVDRMVEKKFNVLPINVYGCWNVQYDGKVSEFLYVPLKSHPEMKTPMRIKYYSPAKKQWIIETRYPPLSQGDAFGELCRYARERGIKVVPAWNSYGHNTYLPALYPEISAKEEDGTPSLTSFCTSNEKTYEVLFSIYDEIIDTYLKPNGFDAFGLGMDEVRDAIARNEKDIFKTRVEWCRCPKCRVQDRGDLFINHAVRLIEHVVQKGMRSVSMACDMLLKDRAHSVGYLGDRLLAALKEKGLDKNIVLGWWSYSDEKSKLSFQNMHPELGLRAMGCPWNGYYSWALVTLPLKNVRLIAEMGERDGYIGIRAYSMWDESYDLVHDCIADYAWNFKGAGDNRDVVRRYCLRHFGKYALAAEKAFDLWHYATGNRQEKYARISGTEDPTAPVSVQQTMLEKCAGYWCSYVKAGEPYPRPFFGFGLSYLLEEREDKERTLLQSAAMAGEAAEIFRRIARDPSADVRMADRFAYECENARCIAEDWLAVLKIYDLIGAGETSEAARLARRREKARLIHLARLEQVKEPYAVEAMAGRIQSTFLVSFRDLADFLESHPDASPDLLGEGKEFYSGDHFALR